MWDYKKINKINDICFDGWNYRRVGDSKKK